MTFFGNIRRGDLFFLLEGRIFLLRSVRGSIELYRGVCNIFIREERS